MLWQLFAVTQAASCHQLGYPIFTRQSEVVKHLDGCSCHVAVRLLHPASPSCRPSFKTKDQDPRLYAGLTTMRITWRSSWIN